MSLIVRILFFLMAMSPVLLSRAQGYISIVDDASGQTVPFAHVLIQGIDCAQKVQLVSDASGIIPNQATCKSLLLITFIGYANYSDTILPGRSIKVRLKPEVLSMEGCVVTAQFTPQTADRSIYRVEVISKLELRERAANNLEDALRNQVSIRTSRDAVLGSSLSLQGLGGEHVKFLVDGVPVIGRMNGSIDLGQLNLNNVEQIEILEGPMSVIYGSNALAGAINIITSQPKSKSQVAQLNLYGESTGTFNGDFQTQISGEGHSLAFSGGRYFYGGYQLDTTLRGFLWKPKRQLFGEASYGHRWDKANLRLSFDYFDELIQDKGELLPPYYEKAIDKYYQTVRSNTKLLYRRYIRSGSYVDMVASASFYDRYRYTYIKDLTILEQQLTTNESDHDTSSFHNYLLRATFSNQVSSKPIRYQLGIDLNQEYGFGKRMAGGEQVMKDYGVFYSMQFDPFKGMQIQPGLRLAYNNTYKPQPVYSLNLKYDLHKNAQLRFSYARGFRAPSLKELYLYFVDVNHNIQGNPDLGAEDSHNLNASATWRKPIGSSSLVLEGSVFYNKVNNIITLAEIQLLDYTYINLEEFRSKGLKLEAKLRIQPNLRYDLGLARTGRLSIADASVLAQYSFAYSTSMSNSLVYNWRRTGMILSLHHKYNGKLPVYRFNAEGDLEQSNISPYHMIDLSLSRRFWANRIMITTGMNNLLGHVQVESLGLDGSVHGGGGSGQLVGTGRTGFFKLSVDLQRRQKEKSSL
jgi:outer membrane receptor for ferrienterochelin and colicins